MIRHIAGIKLWFVKHRKILSSNVKMITYTANEDGRDGVWHRYNWKHTW